MQLTEQKKTKNTNKGENNWRDNMKLATNLAWDQLNKIAKKLEIGFRNFKNKGYTRNGKNVYQFTLKAVSNKYRKIGFTGRRTANVSFQGYTQFMKDVFKEDPQAYFTSKFGKVNAANIDYMEGVVGDTNIGSQMEPMLYRDAGYDKEKADELKRRFA